MQNIIGILMSFLFVGIVIAIATLLEKSGKLGSEGSRKFIHIGVSNWWIIAMIYFKTGIAASIVPAIFILLNYISYKKNLISSMERGGGLEDLGTVYYAISLTILAFITFSIGLPFIGAVGILTMGYGDGFAALFGESFGRHKLFFNKKKSLEGSLAMFFASAVVAIALLAMFTNLSIFVVIGCSIALSTVATILEAITPLGFDNLTVPLITSLLVYILV